MSEFGAAQAEELLREWTKSESLVKHWLAVAACTESYGVREAAAMGLGDAEADAFAERYRCAGLLHDFDYEKHPTPEEHPFVGVAVFAGAAVGRRRFCMRFWRTRIIQVWSRRRIWTARCLRAMNWPGF